MMTTLACWIVSTLVLGGQVAGAAASPWVVVQDATGREVLSFVAQTEPFKPGVLPRGGESRNVRDEQGRTITGFSYYGWTSGSSVHVIVLAEVPADQAKRGSLPSDDLAIRYEQVGSYTLAIGESRQVTEKKAFGGEPTTIQIVTRR